MLKKIIYLNKNITMSFFKGEFHSNNINYDSDNGIIIKNSDNTTGNMSLSQSGITLTSNGGGSSKGIQFKSSDGDISTSNVWSMNLFSNSDNALGIWHNGTNYYNCTDNGLFIIKSQGNTNTTGLRIDNSSGGSWVLNTWNDGDLVMNRNNVNRFYYSPNGLLNIKTLYNDDYLNGDNRAKSGIRLQNNGDTQNWVLNIASDNDLVFFYSGNTRGYLSRGTNEGAIDFTGQHRSLLNKNIDNSSIGLIVSSTGKYVNLDNTLNTKINESLPLCEITNIDNDKKVFGVLSDKEDSETMRSYNTGNWGSVYSKQNTNEQRMFINSVGEGAIWVCNKNGNIENGDYITSSTVPGYGVKQSDLILYAYTVAKITCDCNFSTTKIVKQKLKVISTTDTDGNTTTEIDYDTNGDVQYEDDLDENGNQQMVYPLETRFLLPDGTQITEEEYNTRLGNGENVYIACFVGCTYHCG